MARATDGAVAYDGILFIYSVLCGRTVVRPYNWVVDILYTPKTYPYISIAYQVISTIGAIVLCYRRKYMYGVSQSPNTKVQ